MLEFGSIAEFIVRSFDQAVSGVQTGGGPLVTAIFVLSFFSYLLGKSHGSNRDLQNKFSSTINKLDGLFGKLQRLENTVNLNFGNITKNFETVKETLFKNYERTKKIYKLTKREQPSDEERDDIIKIEDLFSETENQTESGDEEASNYSMVETSEPEQRVTTISATRQEVTSLWSKLRSILGDKKPATVDLNYLKERLLLADTGSELAEQILKDFANRNGSDWRMSLKQTLAERVLIGQVDLSKPKSPPRIFIFVGVNGVGKTSTVAKMANILKNRGFKVMTVAGDTFRAGAEEQLIEWCLRINVECFYQKSADKPQTVVYDAVKKAINESYDYVLIDTAGRLHNKSHLMQELSGVIKSIRKQLPDQPDHIFLVIDATTGQTAVKQAEEFHEMVGISSIIVTKLDSSAKGGALFAIFDRLKLPVSFVSLGEDVNSLVEFDGEMFLEKFLS